MRKDIRRNKNRGGVLKHTNYLDDMLVPSTLNMAKFSAPTHEVQSGISGFK